MCAPRPTDRHSFIDLLVPELPGDPSLRETEGGLTSWSAGSAESLMSPFGLVLAGLADIPSAEASCNVAMRVLSKA